MNFFSKKKLNEIEWKIRRKIIYNYGILIYTNKILGIYILEICI